MPLSNYIKAPQIFQAIQLTPDNVEEVLKLFPMAKRIRSMTLMLSLFAPDKVYSACAGDWLVKTSGATVGYEVYPDLIFRALFISAEEPVYSISTLMQAVKQIEAKYDIPKQPLHPSEPGGSADSLPQDLGSSGLSSK